MTKRDKMGSLIQKTVEERLGGTLMSLALASAHWGGTEDKGHALANIDGLVEATVVDLSRKIAGMLADGELDALLDKSE